MSQPSGNLKIEVQQEAEESESTARCEVPRILHTVWVGPSKMSDGSLRNVKTALQCNPNFRCHLWVDSEGTGNVINDYIADYKKYFAEVIDRLEIKDIKSLKGECEEIKESVNSIRYQIDKPSPDYGNASDRIRYDALFLEGGFYFDCGDVSPKYLEIDEAKGIFGTVKQEKLLLIHYTKNKDINNDILISSKGNPDVLQIIKRCNANDEFKLPQDKLSKVNVAQDEIAFRSFLSCFDNPMSKRATVALTGTRVIQSCFNVFESETIKSKEYGYVPRNLFSTPDEQALSWLGKPFARAVSDDKPTFEKLVLQVCRLLKYEAKNGFFRLDTYALWIARSIVGENASLENCIKKKDEATVAILSALCDDQSIDYKKVRGFHRLFNDEKVDAFYKNQMPQVYDILFPQLAFFSKSDFEEKESIFATFVRLHVVQPHVVIDILSLDERTGQNVKLMNIYFLLGASNNFLNKSIECFKDLIGKAGKDQKMIAKIDRYLSEIADATSQLCSTLNQAKTVAALNQLKEFKTFKPFIEGINSSKKELDSLLGVLSKAEEAKTSLSMGQS